MKNMAAEDGETTMGYSATKAAFDTLNRVIAEAQQIHPRNETTSNGWKADDGSNCFYEIGDERPDGAIVGYVMKEVLPSNWHKSWGDYRSGCYLKAGSFSINALGKVIKFPGLPNLVNR